MKSLRFFLILLPMIQFSFAFGDQIKLERKELIIDEKDEGFFKTIADIEAYKDYLFIVDNAYHRVLEFKIKNNKLEFQRFIGRKGQGPGDLELPLRISIWNDTLAVQDQLGISFFDIDGAFKRKFRLFSGGISFSFIKNNIYYATTNPTKSNFIEVYSMDGKRLYTFGEKKKFFDLDYNIHKGMRPTTAEIIIFNGFLLSDEDYIYYINRRFGTLIKFTISGKKFLETNITPLFGKNELEKAKENRKLFLEKGFNLFEAKGRIPQNYIFRSAKISDNNIYLLSDQWNFLEKKLNSFLEIKCIDKNNFGTFSTYQTSLSEDERLLYLAVRIDQENPVFIVVSDSEEGFKIYECKPIQNVRQQ